MAGKNKNNKEYKRFKIPYLFSEGIKGLYRNKVLSATSILVLTACIVVVGIFIILTHIIENNLSKADELYVVTAYVSADTNETDALSARDEISGFDNVKGVKYVSKKEALDELRSEGDGLSDVVDKYESELSGFIRPRFEVSFESYDRLDALVSALEGVSTIEEVNTKLDLYHGISSLKSNVTKVSSALVLLLFFVAVFVTLNTVRIGIYYRKEEISLLRYMGATKAFITSPFVIECFFMGVVAVILAFVSEFAVYTLLIEKWAVEYGLTGLSSFWEYMPVLIPTFLGVGILASTLSGAICVKKYLNV